jgi:hypothetical protein
MKEKDELNKVLNLGRRKKIKLRKERSYSMTLDEG